MQYRDGSLLCLWLFSIAACESTTERIVSCPVIRGRGAAYGALIGTASFAPGACIEVFDEGRRLAHTNASNTGTFAIQFAEGEMRDDSIQVRVTAAGLRPAEYTVHVNARQHAEITYRPGSAPIVASESGSIRMRGTLTDPNERPSFSSPPITTAWVTNWSTGVVDRMVPQPVLEVPFEASVPGRAWDPVSPITRHGAQDAIGGCYWPYGGGYAFGCTQEAWDRGSCRGGPAGPCIQPRGCEPLRVEEPERPAPFHQEDPIPQGPPNAEPFDAGMPDAGTPDAGMPDASEPDADIDVGGPS